MATPRIAAVELALWLACVAAWGGEPAGKTLMRSAGCFACHAVDGVGGNAAPDLTYVGFRHDRLWLETWLKDPHAWKRDTLMPNFRLKPGAMKAIEDYLLSLRGEGWRPWAKAEGLERGALIYQKAGCVACHGVKGVGGVPNNNVHGNAIPALIHVKEGFTTAEIETFIRKGSYPIKEGEGPDPMVRMPKWGDVLSDRDIDAVAKYVVTFDTAPVAPEW